MAKKKATENKVENTVTPVKPVLVGVLPPEHYAYSRELIKKHGGIYIGSCVVQSPNAWTFAGPTWYIPDMTYITYGRCVANWGTTLGIAQCATAEPEPPKPMMFQACITSSPMPNLVLEMLPKAYDALQIKDLVEEVESPEVAPAKEVPLAKLVGQKVLVTAGKE